MQGQRGTVGSLPDSINFDYESPNTNVDIDQQICWNNLQNPSESRLSDYRISASNSDNTFVSNVSQEGQILSRWTAGDSSSGSPLNLVAQDERLNQVGWSASINTSVGAGSRLNELRYEPANLVSQPVINLNLNINQTVNGPAFVRGSSSGSASQNFDLNEGHFNRVGNDMGRLNSSKPVGFESKFHPSAGSSLDPFSSPGNGRFLTEDCDGRPDCSLDGRRLPCKRKSLEGNAGQSSSGGNLYSRAEGSSWRAIPSHFDASSSMNIAASPEISSNVPHFEEVNPRLRLGMSGRVLGDNVCPVNVSSGLETSNRNYGLRMSPSIPQDSMLNSSFLPVPIGVTRHSDAPSVHPPTRFVPMNPPPDLMSPIPSEIPVPHNPSVTLRAPTMQRNVQSHRWRTLRPEGSSISAVPGERDAVLLDDSSSRNLPRHIGEHPMFAPLVEARSSASNPTNWSPSNGSVGISRNSGSSSRSGSNAGSHSSGGSTRVSHRHPTSQYSRRLSEYVRRSLLSTIGSDIAGQFSSSNQHHPIPASSQDGVPPSSGGNQGHNHAHSRSAVLRERQGDGVDGIPYLRALAAAGEGRIRLVSEIRNALDLIRRGEGLRIEDIMLIDHSVLFGRADIHDQHRDMRLDVDNMSYEELLALEDRIGNVCTGLNEETIVKCMKQHKHVHTMKNDQTEAEPCCVCQEVYKDGEDIGTLDCGHDFHKECIKQWLLQKNLCPICKTTGLAHK